MVNPSYFNPKINPSKEPVVGGSFEKRTVPKGGKDFKKVMAGNKEQAEEDEEQLIKRSQDDPLASSEEVAEELPSLLSLAAKKPGKLPDDEETPLQLFEGEGEEGNQAVAQDIALGQQIKKTKLSNQQFTEAKVTEGKEDSAPLVDSTAVTKKPPQKARITEKQESPLSVYQQVSARDKKEKGFSEFTQDQPDIAYLNPVAGRMESNAAAPVMDARPASRAPYIHDIVKQMVEQIQRIEMQGKPDVTIVTLKYPPMFENANVVLTEIPKNLNTTQKPQFDISFENLSTQAKHLLDLQQNRSELKLALEEKGYGVHIVVTTTEIEHPVITGGTMAQSNNRDRRDEDAPGGNPKRQQQQRQG